MRGAAAANPPANREALLAFYDFPVEQWKHRRTSNPIERTFTAVRDRMIRSKGCLSNKTALATIFKLAQAAEKTWHRLDGHNQLSKLILGQSSTTDSRSSDQRLISQPPDLARHQHLGIALLEAFRPANAVSVSLHRRRLLALFGLGSMSDLSPQCTRKRTLTNGCWSASVYEYATSSGFGGCSFSPRRLGFDGAMYAVPRPGFDPEIMRAVAVGYPVSTVVNTPKNDTPECIAPAA